MTFEQLLYFQTLAYSRSLSQAAKTLSISKSGLSTAISDFEAEIGVKVFKRDYQGTKVTAAGQTIITDIARILRSRNELLNDIHHLQSNYLPRRVKIQYVNSILNPIITKCFLENNQSHIRLDVSCHHTETIVNNVRTGQIDAGLIDVNEISYTKKIIDLKFIPICTSRIMMFVGPTNPLYGQAVVTKTDLLNQRFSLYNDSSNDETFARLQMVCGPLDLGMRTDDYQMMMTSVLNQGNVGIGRYLELQHDLWLEGRGLRLKPLNNLIPDRFTYGIIVNPNSSLRQEVSKIFDQLTLAVRNAIK